MNTQPFASLQASAANHFKLYFYAAVLHVLDRVFQTLGSADAAFEQFPFLLGYVNELALHGLEGVQSDEAPTRWRDALLAWEASADVHLPIRALRSATGLEHEAITLLFAIALCDEDARFGSVFALLQHAADQRHPTVGLLRAWWEAYEGARLLRQLQALGLTRTANADAPRAEWQLHVPAPLWDALHGGAHESLTLWAHWRAPATLLALDDLIVSDALRKQLQHLQLLMQHDDAPSVIVRGAQHNGRRTLLGALARSSSRGLLSVEFSPRLNQIRVSDQVTIGLPLHDLSDGGKYNIIVGLQLSAEQLDFNRKQQQPQ